MSRYIGYKGDKYSMLIGEKIKVIRESEKMTQEQVGEQLHLTRQTISNWENGKSYPGIAEIVAISNQFDVSLDELMKEDMELIQHYEVIDGQFNRQRKLYTFAYIVNIIFLGLSMINNYVQLETAIRIGLMIIGTASIVVMYTTIKHPVNLLKNRWALALVIVALLYFLSFAVFKSLHGSPSYRLGMICGDAARIFVLTSSIYFLPQPPFGDKGKA